MPASRAPRSDPLLVAGVATLALALGLASTAPAARPPVVVLDPGHDLRANPATEPIGPGSSVRKIKDGGGTRGVVSGLSEAELNLAVARRLRPLLERAGVRVVMTRTTTAGTSMGNIARARIANRAGAASSFGSTPTARPTARIAHAHALPRAAPRLDGRRLRPSRSAPPAPAGGARALARLSRPRLAGAPDFTGFNWADVPVALVELGFMTNPTEDRLLATPAYQRRAAVGSAAGRCGSSGAARAPCGP